MRLLRRDLHSLSGAYALDALEHGGRARPVHPPPEPLPVVRRRGTRLPRGGHRDGLRRRGRPSRLPGLRDRVLAAAARTRQVPPEVAGGSHARPRRTRSRVPWVPWLSGVVATASIVVAVLFGLAQAHTQDELNQVRAENRAISLLLSSPQVTLLSKSTAKGGVATVVLSAARHQLAVVTNGLPALPPGKVYQLWLIGKTKTTSAGLLPPAKAGQTPPVLAAGVVKGDTLGLTVEPAAGSAQPTTKPILALPLPV